MIQEDDAVARILAHVRPLPSRQVALVEALNCFSPNGVAARLSLPPFDNSAMDGYAVVASSCSPGARLKIVGEQPAGVDRGFTVAPGEALRIFTGAPMPAGADAVIMQEEVTLDDDMIVLGAAVEPGDFVRRRGGDVAEGQRILSAGDRITPQAIALLAAQGIGTLEVGGQIRAAIISTGDELAAPAAPLRSGQIYDSNSLLLHALLLSCGVDVASVTHAADRSDEIEAAISAGAGCDAMIISGGVSVGARDLVKPALTSAGASLDLWRVAVKPGKPFLFGHAPGCAIFGLPGNPVSAFVTFLLFVRPALLRLMGASDAALPLPQTEVRLTTDVDNPGDRPHYIRGRLEGGTFTPIGRQESHALFGLSRSNALLRAKPGEKIAAGSSATALTWQ
jgi:molybdopterin molybdotransferase